MQNNESEAVEKTPYKSNRIIWLSVLQGWSMLLVVIGHITLTNVFQNPATPMTAQIETLIYSFHMPLFMFISGYLFYYTKIRKDSLYSSTMKDKARRLLVPYAFFTLCTFFIKYIFSSLMKNPVELSVQEIFRILTFTSNPLSEMWFISTLFILFLFYPLYKYSLKNEFTILIMLIFCILLNLFFPNKISIFNLSKVASYMLYLYLGILFSKYDLFRYLENLKVLIISLVLFVLFNLFFSFSLVLSLIGILFSICLCLTLSKYTPSLFNSFRDYTFQIFLMGIFFQMAIRFLYLKIGQESLYLPLCIISVLLGIYMPVCIAHLINKIKYPTIRLLFGL